MLTFDLYESETPTMPASVRTVLLVLVASVIVTLRATTTEPSAEPQMATQGRPIAKKALECLAMNIYHEARGEPLGGQLAIAAVTLNRVNAPAFPNSVCGVVKQGGQRPHHRCQFSWWCDGKSDIPKDKRAWAQARQLAWLSLNGLVEDPTDGALYFHTKHVRPGWSKKFQRTTRIGQHQFYKPTQRASSGQSLGPA
jgi:spore germination cell wall hydrolase CwlJ-like protein